MIDAPKKQAYIFDLDGTLAESKQPLDQETGNLLARLLERSKVAIISGGSYRQIETQFVSHLPQGAMLGNLCLFPASATAFYRYESGGWHEVYSERLAETDKQRIRSVLLQTEKTLGLSESRTYGEKVEDRGSQMTYSALGQSAPIEVKKFWDPDQSKRKRIVELATPFLSGLSVGIGGMTSIDVTRGGMDKGHGVRRIAKELDMPLARMIFIGDALFPGGNDYPARATGIDCVEVKNPADTKAFIRNILGDK